MSRTFLFFSKDWERTLFRLSLTLATCALILKVLRHKIKIKRVGDNNLIFDASLFVLGGLIQASKNVLNSNGSLHSDYPHAYGLDFGYGSMLSFVLYTSNKLIGASVPFSLASYGL